MHSIKHGTLKSFWRTLAYCLLVINTYILKADELAEYNKKPQYADIIAYLATDYNNWNQQISSVANKKNNDIKTNVIDNNKEFDFITNRERDELEIGRLLDKSNKKKRSILPYVTHAGKFGLYNLLLHPSTDIETITKRQDFIKALTEEKNKDTYEELQKLLEKLAKNELSLFSYWNPNDPLAQKASSIYFNQPKTFFWLCTLPKFTEVLNHSATVLELTTIKEFFKKIFFINSLFGLGGVADNIQNTLFGVEDLDVMNSFVRGIKGNINSVINQYNFTEVDYEILGDNYNIIDNSSRINKRRAALLLFYDFLLGSNKSHTKVHSAGTRTDILQNLFRKNGITIPYPIAAGVTLGRSLLSTYLIYVLLQDQIQGVVNTYSTLQKLHTHTVAVAQYIKTLDKIEKLLKDHQDERIRTFYHDSLISKVKVSKKMKEVLKLLHTATFEKDGYIWYFRGKVLLAHKLLQETYQELTNSIRNVALIDAHISVATFMKEAAGKGMPTCFVQFLNDEEPVELTITEGWSPLIICQQQVCNSITLGGQKAGIIVLTGPNGCGKSTVLRVLAMVALLAQIFGVSPAQSVTMSLFRSIRTSFKINDNASNGLSTYMAADEAAEYLRTHIDQLDHGHRSLILYGEPYRGTPDQETARKIMDFCHDIAPNKHFIMALETHVFEPTTLEKELPDTFTNGYMEINEDVDGNFIRTFSLKDGPAVWWFFDHEKRKRFVDWITVVRKQEEIAQKAYEAALMQAYEEALIKAKQEQAEHLKKEKSSGFFEKGIKTIKSLF